MKFSEYIRRVGATIALVALALLVWHLRYVVLLAFAAVVVAVIVTAAAYPLRRFTGLRDRHAAMIATAALVVLLGFLIWFSWPSVTQQGAELGTTLQESLMALQERTGIPLGDSLSRLLDNPGTLIGGIWRDVVSFATVAASGATTAFLVVIAGIYLALDPQTYIAGIVKLMPPGQNERTHKALSRTGRGLQLWLIGKIAAMTITGVLVGLGAWIIGLPSPLALGVIAFWTAFVPVIGPIVGAVPGLLIAFTQGGTTLLWTVALYIVVQQIESNMITPVIQRRAVSIPPALFIISIVAMGVLFGTIGLLLSGPLTVATYVLVRALYVEDVLGEDIDKKQGI